MKCFLLLHILIFTLFLSYAQIGDVFPVMEVETLQSKEVMLPDFCNGKYTLLGLAYSKKAEKDLSTWYSPIFKKFLQPKLGKNDGLFASFSYDVNTYFIPMFTGIAAAAEGKAKKKAIQNVDPKLQAYILFFKGKIKEYKSSLQMIQKDKPYFFLLDESGKIIHQTTGAYTVNKMKVIEENIDDF
ncbi:MAG: hypothetical protein AB8B61_05000 [Cyclobacteriaceae bacterium]